MITTFCSPIILQTEVIRDLTPLVSVSDFAVIISVEYERFVRGLLVGKIQNISMKMKLFSKAFV